MQHRIDAVIATNTHAVARGRGDLAHGTETGGLSGAPGARKNPPP